MSIYKTYAYIKFTLESPLAIGSGDSKETDKDVLRNSKGEPYIPASALAGIYSTFFSKEKNNNEEFSEVEKYFGYVDIVTSHSSSGQQTGKNSKNKKRYPSRESRLIVYDAVLCKDTYNGTGIRNGVGLDRFRTARDGAKFDFEIVHPGAVFETYIEYTSDDADLYPINKIVSAWCQEQVAVGAKTTRGLGQLKHLDLRVKTFILPVDRKAWLLFDIFHDTDIAAMDPWDQKNLICSSNGTMRITLTLNQKGISPLTVRVYSTDVAADEESAPDYSHLTYIRKDQDKPVAVIPGTSWAGSFRHHMAGILAEIQGKDISAAEEELKNLFGTVEEKKKEAFRSKISFSETYYENGNFKTVSRNAIDRFSGGAADTALFTEMMYYGGKEGKLTITIPKDIKSEHLQALAVSIADLHEGFLTVGGESSIGHGLFDLTSIGMTGKDAYSGKISGSAIYSYIIPSQEEGEA